MKSENVSTTTTYVSDMDFDAYDAQWYFNAYHFNGIISVISTSIAIYFILFKSPPSIGEYKWFLLNISICSQIFDFLLTILWMPQGLFPAMAMCSNGIVRHLGWEIGALGVFFIFVIMLGACIISIVWAFVYRWAILTRRGHYFTRKSTAVWMIFTQLIYMMPTAIFCILSILDRERMIFEIKRRYPKIAPHIDERTTVCTFASYEASPFTKFFIGTAVLEIFASTPLAFTFLLLSYRALDESKHMMSAKTAQQHKQLLKALLFQLLVPFGSFFVPYTVMCVLIFFAVENIILVYQLVFIIGTLHSFFNTVMMISKINVYRRVFIHTVLSLPMLSYFRGYFVPEKSGTWSQSAPQTTTRIYEGSFVTKPMP